jgi:hypothetical protein
MGVTLARALYADRWRRVKLPDQGSRGKIEDAETRVPTTGARKGLDPIDNRYEELTR